MKVYVQRMAQAWWIMFCSPNKTRVRLYERYRTQSEAHRAAITKGFELMASREAYDAWFLNHAVETLIGNPADTGETVITYSKELRR